MEKQNRYWTKKSIWNFADSLRDKFNGICPYGKKYLDSLVLKSIKEVILISIVVIVLVVLWNGFIVRSTFLFFLEGLCFAVYLVMMEVPNYRYQEKENNVYRELLIYFSRVKHRYMASHHIANAVLEAGLDMSYEVQRLSDELYRVLMESDRKEKVREYILYHRTNRYLKLFLIQAYEASEKGDVLGADGASLFSENIEHLRLELMEELYRKKRRAHEFAGYTFVAVAPVFMMPVLKQWGLDFAPELDFFYTGTGLLLESITFGVTIIIYKWISQAKEIALLTERVEDDDRWEWIYHIPVVSSLIHCFEQADWKIGKKIRRLLLVSGERVSFGKFCFQMLLIAGMSFFVLSSFCVMIHRRERQAVLNKVDTIDVIAPIAGEEKKAILENHIIEITRQCKTNENISEEQIRALLRARIRLGSESMENAAVKEIKNKVEQYGKAHCRVYEVFICLLLSMVIGSIPLWRLYYRIQIVSAGAVHEVRLFQSVIIMERRMQGVTIVGLLEDMEVFSNCFKEVLQRCINSYGAGAKSALLRLKEEGKRLHEGFEELADAFLSVDDIGIELAFQEVESNRKLLEKMTQLEAEINMERKKDATDLLAKVPMLLAVGVYFVIPFFVHALQGVYEVFELMEDMQI